MSPEQAISWLGVAVCYLVVIFLAVLFGTKVYATMRDILAGRE